MKIIKEFGRNPHVDWITILFVSALIALGLAFTGYTLYNAVATGSIEGKDKGTSFPKVNEKPIASVLELFAAKEEVSAKMRGGYTGAPDPSI